MWCGLFALLPMKKDNKKEINQYLILYLKPEKETGRIKSPLLDKGAFIRPYGCVRSAEGFYQRSADTGELHSPTGISFPTPCVLHARRYPALQSIICHEV